MKYLLTILATVVLFGVGCIQMPKKNNIDLARDRKGNYLRVYQSALKGDSKMTNTGVEFCEVSATAITCKDLRVILP